MYIVFFADFQEEEIRNFQEKLQQLHRPSCVAMEKDLRKCNFNSRFNDSALGKVCETLIFFFIKLSEQFA